MTDDDEDGRRAGAQRAGRGLKVELHEQPGREFTSRLDANVAAVDFACVTAAYMVFFVALRLPFSFLCGPSGQFGLCC